MDSFYSVTEQVARTLRDGLRTSRWKHTIPGRNRLATELGVNHKTVQAALNQLERQGLLESQGPGRERKIMDLRGLEPVALRIRILAYDKDDLKSPNFLEILHRLRSAGHLANFANKTLIDLGRNVSKVSSFVAKTDADAWIVIAAPRSILNWFSEQPFPAFALFGRVRQVRIASAGPKKDEALLELTDRLFEAGHRRIVMIVREERRSPTPGTLERVILDRLEQLGIRTGPYNLPDWGDDPDSLCRGLDSMFRHTPPTALIIDDPVFFLTVTQHLARMGISAPEKVSLACMDSSSFFEWSRPKVTHVTWNSGAVTNRVVNWTNQISRGKRDRRMTLTRAKLVLGGTIGPVPKKPN